MVYVPGSQQAADILTKPLEKWKHDRFVQLLGLTDVVARGRVGGIGGAPRSVKVNLGGRSREGDGNGADGKKREGSQVALTQARLQPL